MTIALDAPATFMRTPKLDDERFDEVTPPLTWVDVFQAYVAGKLDREEVVEYCVSLFPESSPKNSSFAVMSQVKHSPVQRDDIVTMVQEVLDFHNSISYADSMFDEVELDEAELSDSWCGVYDMEDYGVKGFDYSDELVDDVYSDADYRNPEASFMLEFF